MIRVVKRWPDQIVHARIGNGEDLLRRGFHIENSSHENSRISGNHAPRLEEQPYVEVSHGVVDETRVV